MDKRKKKRIIVWSVIGVGILLLVVLMFIGKRHPVGAQLMVEPARMDSIEISVSATGEIQPVYKVEVGTQVSGIVEKLYVDYNSVVQKGDLLAELDRSTLQEQVNQAQANLNNAESSLKFVQQTYNRVKALYDNKAATQAAYEEACNNLIVSQNQLLNAQSDLQRAQVNLSYAKIYSPIDGIIMSKSVEQGQTVAASFNTPTIFTIANTLLEMQVEAKVDEADIGQVQVGQSVTFTVDAFPNDLFTGEVRQIRLQPEITSNVVTYTVIIDAPNLEEKLMPGMTANVNIIIKQARGVTLPMEALFFTLSPETQRKMSAMGVTFESLFSTEAELTNSLKDVSKKSIWVKNGNSYTQRMVDIGIDDGAKCIILKGINEGEEVVVSEQMWAGNPNPQGKKSMMFGPPKERKR